jgi:hypothetical protein
MITIRHNKLISVLLIMTLVASASSALAYPPDNAAVLYYKAFMLYQPEHEINLMLWDYWKGFIESNKRIEEYLIKNRRIIDIVLDATLIDHCDWGLDYSQGTEVLLPPHQKAREIFVLLAVDARMQAQRGDYREALGRCISMYRMTRHLNERPLITYLVGGALNAATSKCMTLILSEMPQDIDTLTWLKDQLIQLDKQPYSVKPALRWKREAGIISMLPERITHVVQSGLDDGPTKKKALERIRTADQQFFAKNIAYWNHYMDSVEAAFDLPYAEAYAKLQQLDEGLSDEFAKNPDATLTACLAPGFFKIYLSSVLLENRSNAIRAAVEVYLIKAATGSLPETLPAGVPGDLYSGKPFQYAKTIDGFVLRCQAKDLHHDMTREYEFKVKK